MAILKNVTYAIAPIEIPWQEPVSVFAIFAGRDGSVFLDSAQHMPACGRYSFIAIDPFLMLTSKNGKINPFDLLASELARFSLDIHAGLPPFQGGAVGFFSYELGRHLEKLPAAKTDDMQFPDMAVGLYDLVIGFDGLLKRAWIFSSGFPLEKKKSRVQRAKKRSDWLLKTLNNKKGRLNNFVNFMEEKNIQSNFTCETYQSAVRKVTEYILAGDIFEANISQRFSATLSENFVPFDLYCHLRSLNPAPFASYLNLADTVVASASPERFLKVNCGRVEARPIKGTRPRGKNNIEDAKLARDLLESEKDRAENVMIVDVLRNDLSRVCEDGSVHVPQLCELESYAAVHHLVSVVTGQLRPGMTAINLLRASFPGGSITGAPKIRAMEIIAEIEPVSRGPYCGSVGYIGFNGDMDLSITIRTFVIKDKQITFQAGGAIVADSDPMMEYEETLTKSRVLRKALVGQ